MFSALVIKQKKIHFLLLRNIHFSGGETSKKANKYQRIRGTMVRVHAMCYDSAYAGTNSILEIQKYSKN